MTAVPSECEAKRPRPRLVRSRRALLGACAAAAISIAIGGSLYFGFNRSQNEFQEALIALDQGDLNLARGYLRELKASQPDSPHARFVQGAMLLEKGYYDPALDELSQARQDPELETASLTLMGQAWCRLGRHVEAEAALQQVLKHEPDSVDAHRWLAASYYDLGLIDKAALHLQRTAQLAPADPRPHRLLGLMHKDFERYEDAIPLYEESLRRKSDQDGAAEIRQELAICQIKSRRYGDALKTLEQCPDSPEFEVLRAECHHGKGRAKTAKAMLERALAQEGDNLDGLLLRGTILLEEGDARAAIDAFQRAIKHHPKDYTAHFRLAQAYGNAGEQELSEGQQEIAERIRVIRHEFSQLHKTASKNPNNVDVRLRLAFLARELDRPDLAEVWLRSAAALRPEVADQGVP